MKIRFLNNWKEKCNWNKILSVYFNRDFFGINHLLIGVFNFYIFITW